MLAIIAYRQPATKTYIERVRGVDSSNTVNSLCDKGLIEECGRLDVPGRPILYCTTAAFLRAFGLSSLEELPELPELRDIPTETMDQITLSQLEEEKSGQTEADKR